MAKTKNFILRIDSEMMDAIEAWAADEFRSTNGQLQWIIAEALRKAKRMPKRRKANAKKTEQPHSLPTETMNDRQAGTEGRRDTLRKHKTL